MNWIIVHSSLPGNIVCIVPYCPGPWYALFTKCKAYEICSSFCSQILPTFANRMSKHDLSRVLHIKIEVFVPVGISISSQPKHLQIDSFCLPSVLLRRAYSRNSLQPCIHIEVLVPSKYRGWKEMIKQTNTSSTHPIILDVNVLIYISTTISTI